MIHVGYCSLLLLCISANLIDGMEFGVSKVDGMEFGVSKEIKLESSLFPTTDDDNLWKWENSAQSSTFDFFSASINIDNQSLSGKTDNPYQGDTTQNTTSLLQKFIPTTKKRKSTPSDQKTLIPKKPPRKKRRVDVPDDTYFTITCTNCSEQPLFYAQVRSNLIDNFKRNHLKKTHQEMTCEQIKTYIKNHLKEPKQIEIFPVGCPIPTGKTDNPYQGDTTQNTISLLQQFIPTTKKWKSTPSDQKTLIPKKPPRKKRRVNTKDVPDDAYFTITCTNCYEQPLFYARIKSTLIDNFKKQHLKKTHKEMNHDKIDIYIQDNLKEAKQIEIFSVGCPIPKCQYTVLTDSRANLKNILFRHVCKTEKHQNEKKNHTKESLAKYIKEKRKSKSVSNPNFLSMHSNYVC